ncbi:MAG: hypothetical protein QGG53_08900 [Planctomycetota bacterium]|jgi:predicted DNA-binding antitoxin AbrB/MazE fold protein|nr:hypothetical protein [Planctomycetota bacterium]
MKESLKAHYDGTVLVPDEPVNLPVGTPLRIQVEVAESGTSPFKDLLEFEADLPDAPPDLAAQHDHYLYGTPKR